MVAARHRIGVLAVISVGGVIGATARYAVGQLIPTPSNGFPVSTLVINVLGSFVLGVVASLGGDDVSWMRYARPFFAVGVIGSFTTFSAFAVENVVLVDDGRILVAVAYVPIMLLGGLLAARSGIEVARRMARRWSFLA